MNEQSIFFTILTGLIALAVMLIIIQIISKRLGINSLFETQINISNSIWVSSIMISFVTFLKSALDLVENAIETIIFSKTINNTFIAVIEKISIFIGFTFVFTFLSYYLISFITRIFIGKKDLKNELEKNNVGYFVISGFCLILFTYLIVNLFEHFLRWFSPIVETPFYH